MFAKTNVGSNETGTHHVAGMTFDFPLKDALTSETVPAKCFEASVTFSIIIPCSNLLDVKVKELKAEISKIVNSKGLKVEDEYLTGDGTRVDLAIVDDKEKVLAVEFEKTYKWIHQRVLYNSVKAQREGFRKILFVYPFNKASIEKSWVIKFITENLNMVLEISSPSECLTVIDRLLGSFD